MRSNYFTIHKNKKPKKAKYSKPYSELQLQKNEACTQYFLSEIQKITDLKFKHSSISHWAEGVNVGEKCVATIRHKTDGLKNKIDVIVSVLQNDIFNKKILANYENNEITIPYNELSEFFPS